MRECDRNHGAYAYKCDRGHVERTYICDSDHVACTCKCDTVTVAKLRAHVGIVTAPRDRVLTFARKFDYRA